MPDRPAIQALSELLQSGHAKPKVRTERLMPAAIYDLDYRTLVIAAAFEIHAKALPPFGRRIHATKLKFLQFVAIRPWLLPVMEAWGPSEKGVEASFSAQDVRRGFLGDKMYDAVVAFLVARGALEWMGSHLAAGPHAELLTQLYAGAVGNELFAAERKALNDLTRIKVTIRMLEGL
jgi:hypothetical protein